MMVPVGRLILLRSRAEVANWSTRSPGSPCRRCIGPLIGPPRRRLHHHLLSLALDLLDQRAVRHRSASCSPRSTSPDIAGAGRAAASTVAGFLLAGLGLAALIFGFTVLGRDLLPGWAVARADRAAARAAGRLCAAMRGARRIPILDLRLLAHRRRSAPSVAGGSVFRIGVGAMPFLLPLMLQVGFGLTPFALGPAHLRGGGGRAAR